MLGHQETVQISEGINALMKGARQIESAVQEIYYAQFDDHYATRIPELPALLNLVEGQPTLPAVEIPPEEDLASTETKAKEVSQTSKKSTAKKAAKKPVSSKSDETPSPPSLVEVRGILAELSRAGYTSQVRDLITSFGFEKLSEIPAELYPQVLAKAEVIGHA